MEQNKNVKPPEHRRVFKGKTEFTIDRSSPQALAASKLDRHFHQRMLRAYLKGKEVFNFGFSGHDAAGRLIPVQHKVLFDWV